MAHSKKVKKTRKSTGPRRPDFNFLEFGIPIGSKLTFTDDETIVAKVTGGRKIECKGNKGLPSSKGFPSTIARDIQTTLFGKKLQDWNGPSFWEFNGETLAKRRTRMERLPNKWTREEWRATLSAYIEMLELERLGEEFDKQKYYHGLSSQFNKRPARAYGPRMQDISYVYDLLGRDLLTGLTPIKQGANTIQIIKDLIREIEEESADPRKNLEQGEYEFRWQENQTEPEGNLSPSKQTTETARYDRKRNIVDWALNNANGVCESCEEPAPFDDKYGKPYLEVHHLIGLAKGGSDMITNVVAVCPNCHRELHHGLKQKALLDNLYQCIERLVKE